MTATESTGETRRVLDMLAQGKINVDEADRLLKALNAPEASASETDGQSVDPSRARWVRINIHKAAGENRQQPKDVNIRVPISVVKGGMRLGAIIATFAGEKAALRMKRRGIDLDLPKINDDLSKMNGPEFEAFLKSLDDVNIEVDDGKSQVRITCE
jgi:SHOCT-like domain